MGTENPYNTPPLVGRARLKRTLLWSGLAFLAVIAAMLIAAWPYIQAAKAQREWNNYVAANRQADYDRKAADKVGSSTPEGTFYEYVAAIKRGDLEGAASYFVPENRAQHLEDLKTHDISIFVNHLSNVQKDLINGWECNNAKTICGVSSTYKFDLEKYPSGNWKITDY